MMENEKHKIEDFVARPYQSNIIEFCKRKNSIVFLPTGAGKSFIAFQVIKHFSHQIEEEGKRSFFLVNTQALAKQQAEAAEKTFTHKVAIVTGEQNVDNFSEAQWKNLLDKNHIFVMTAQCFHDAITKKFIDLKQANVIVFDECHHGRKGHVMHQIMQSFDDDMAHCRVIGLSGMLIGVSNEIKEDTVASELKQLESTFRSTIITVNNLEDQKNALLHSTKAKEFYIKFTFPTNVDCVASICDSMKKLVLRLTPIKLNNRKNLNPKTLRETIPMSIKDLNKLFKDVIYQAQNMGAYGVYLDLLSVLIQLELSKRFGTTEMFRDIVRSCIAEIERCIKKMKTEMYIHKETVATIRDNSSIKVVKLIDCLKEMFTDPKRDKDLQCLVFTQRRSSAKILYHLIQYYSIYSKKMGEEYPLIPDFVVGQNNELPNDIECIISQSFNMKAIEKFSNKETNSIFCTNVLEEGIDLQLCNAVIMYDHPETFRSYMQSRGRARDDDSKYVIMIDAATETKFRKKMAGWKNIDARMKSELIFKTLDRESPTDEEIAKQQTQAWKPFITTNGSQLKPLNAIHILNQYAQTMTSDSFSNTPIDWRRIDDAPRRIRVGIQLPPVIVNEIIGDEQTELKLAKQHAAFKGCIELYRLGELTENLTPFSNEQKIELVENDYFAHWKRYEGDNKKKAGTKNNKRFHAMNIPKLLIQSSPIVGGLNYLYRIAVRPKFDTKDELFLKSFHAMIGSSNSYGILISNRLPKLSKMPLFPTWGEVECEIETPPMQYAIKSEEELRKLRKFQVTIFRDVLESWRTYFVIDKSSFIIVPLDEYKQIDWKLVDQFQQLPKNPLSCSETRSMEFKTHEYLNKVITKTYCEAGNYIVFKVLEDETPLSELSDQYETYKDYYLLKYGLTARNDQFLVKVKGISKNWNLFFPGAGVSGENMRSIDKRSSQTESLIPQFCHNFKFPGDFWLKALLLPSILHRMHFLLLTEELRMRLISEGIDDDMGEQIYCLDVDYGDYKSDDNENDDSDDENLEEMHSDEFEKALKEAMEAQNKHHVVRSKAQLLWDEKKLPMDLERNWQNLTEADIDYYVKFMTDNQGSFVPSNLRHLRKQIGKFIALKGSEIKDIKLLSVNNKKNSIQQKDLIKVLTTSNAGDVFDMERYETLGDAFLKFIASLFIFKSHEKWHEGHLTCLKGRLVSNRNLFYIGNDYGLSAMLKTTKFCDNNKFYGLAPSTSMPHNISKKLKANKNLLTQLLNVEQLSDTEVEEGYLNEKNLAQFSNCACGNFDDNLAANLLEQKIGDKIVADSVEALIGCVVSSIGIHSALKLCGKLNILPDNDGKLNELLTKSIPHRMLVPNASEIRISNRRELEKKIGYNFSNQYYLLQALTHSSNPVKSAGTYEQLEFLGDAVLDFLITAYISEQCPHMDPGNLTDLRSSLVNNVTLACIVVRNELHKFLLYENHLLMETIKRFDEYQVSVQHKVTDQIIFLENEEDSSAAAVSVDVPKCLGDLFESIVGAVFLDSGLSLTKTWDVIYGMLKGELHEFMANVPKQIVRQLFEFHKGSAKPRFFEHQAIEKTGETAVPVRIECRGEIKVFVGIGKNRELAKKAAAKRALKALMQ